MATWFTPPKVLPAYLCMHNLQVDFLVNSLLKIVVFFIFSSRGNLALCLRMSMCHPRGDMESIAWDFSRSANSVLCSLQGQSQTKESKHQP